MARDRIAEALRAAAVPPFHAMAMARRAAEREAAGHRVLHLEVGQPATAAPVPARDAAMAHLAAGDPMGYTNAAGLTSLRRRIARHYGERHGIDVRADDVLVVAGASAGFTLAFLSAFDAGQRVGVLEPGYPCYRNTLLALGVEPVAVAAGAAEGWRPSVASLEAVGPLDGLVVASPSNPTGTVLDSATLGTIAQWCAERGVQLVADEIYHGITYAGAAPSVLARTRDAVVINSFSKYFSMTGWRLGWMVVPRHLRDAVERLQQNLYICASHIAQVAGLAAFDASDELDGHVERYAVNRALLVDGLAAAGIDRIAPADGAFYVYADVGHLTAAAGVGDSLTLTRRWLDEIDVASTPGVDFDLTHGHRYVRFSYAGEAGHLAAAAERLRHWAP
jgi:aspartate/methionine/tyrosine aminotransferase